MLESRVENRGSDILFAVVMSSRDIEFIFSSSSDSMKRCHIHVLKTLFTVCLVDLIAGGGFSHWIVHQESCAFLWFVLLNLSVLVICKKLAEIRDVSFIKYTKCAFFPAK